MVAGDGNASSDSASSGSGEVVGDVDAMEGGDGTQEPSVEGADAGALDSGVASAEGSEQTTDEGESDNSEEIGGSDEGDPSVDAGEPDAAGGAPEPSASPTDIAELPAGALLPSWRGGLCSGGWCWSSHLPQGDTIREMISAAGAEVWAGADGGMLLHHDGQGWLGRALPGSRVPQLWSSADGVVFISNGQTVWRYEAGEFDALPLPESTAPILALSGSSAEDVWAATGDGVLRFDGSSWSAAGLEGASRSQIEVVSPNDVWVNGRVASQDEAPGFFHWDGAQWTVLDTIVPGDMFASGPNDLWYTIGSQLYRGGVEGFVEQEDFPNTNGAEEVFGLAPDEVHVLSQAGALLSKRDGQWLVTSTADESEYGGYPSVGAATAPGEVWLGGHRGRMWKVSGIGDQAAIEQQVPRVSDGARLELHAVHRSGEDVFAVGYRLVKLDSSGEFDAWTVVDDGAGYNDIWGPEPGSMWVVGDYDQILHFDGQELTEAPRDQIERPDQRWRAVHGNSATHAYAVSDRGYSHWDGDTWNTVYTIGEPLHSVWVSPNGNAFFGGENGALAMREPSGDIEVFSDLGYYGITWTALGGTADDNVWVMSGDNLVFRFNGLSWSEVTIPDASGRTIYDIAGVGPQEAWAVGQFGTVLRWDGFTWSPVDVKCWSPLYGIWAGEDGEAWAVGGTTSLQGVVLHRPLPVVP
jgi:hypothetical protein